MVSEQSRSAHVVACARNDTTISWNHSGDDDFEEATFTGEQCGDVSQFIMYSTITKKSVGQTEFVATINSLECEDDPLYTPVVSNAVTCQCQDLDYCKFKMSSEAV